MANAFSLGGYAFRNCSSLKTIALPASLTSIGEYAFEDCSSMTSVALPAGLTSLGVGAFYGCDSLTSIWLPDGLTWEGLKELDDKALLGCPCTSKWRQDGSSTDSDSDGEL